MDVVAGERAAQISNSVLGIARNRNDRFEPTQLKGIVQQSLLLLDRELSKYRISIDCDLPDVPEVCANPNQIQQVLLNLLINARQAMPEGGTIEVRCANRVLLAGQAEPLPPGNYLEISVADQGRGIL